MTANILPCAEIFVKFFLPPVLYFLRKYFRLCYTSYGNIYGGRFTIMITEQDIRAEYREVPEVAEFLGVSERRIRQLLKDGAFPGAFKITDAWLIPRDAVASYTPRKIGRPRSGDKHEYRE